MFDAHGEIDVDDAPNLMSRLEEARDAGLAALWRARIQLHHDDSYAGLPIAKFPEDLRVYEKIIWERAPRVVVEVGVHNGGSTLSLRDRLFDFQRYRCGPAPTVIAVDIDLTAARRNFEALPAEGVAGIQFLDGDIRDPAVIAEIRSRIPTDGEVFVIEDAQHDGATTRAALDGLAPIVRGGGYYVVEDTCVDVEALRVADDWPRGCGIALSEWLASDPLGRRFERRRDLQAYGLTCHPGGIIQRLPDL